MVFQNNNINALRQSTLVNQPQSSINKLRQFKKLSTGLKINRVSDEPTGLAISTQLAERISQLDNQTQLENDLLQFDQIRQDLETIKNQLNQETSGFQFTPDVLNATIESELEQSSIIIQAEQSDALEAGQGIASAISNEINTIADFTVDKVITALEDSGLVEDEQVEQLQEKRSEIQSEIDDLKQTGADFADSFQKFVQGFSSLIATNNVDELGSFVRGTVNFVQPENNFDKDITDNFFEATSQVAVANSSTVDDFLNFFNEGFRDSGTDRLLDNPDLANKFITASKNISGLDPAQLGGEAGFFATSQALLDADRQDILDRFVSAVNEDKTLISGSLVDDLGFTLTQTIDTVANRAIDVVTSLSGDRASDAAISAVLDRSRKLNSEGVTEGRQLNFLERASSLKDVRNLDEFVAAFDAVKNVASSLGEDDLVDRFLQATSSVASGELDETDFFVRVAGIATFSPDELRTQLTGVIVEDSPNETGVLVSGVDENLTNLGEVEAEASTSTLDNIVQLDLSVTEVDEDAITQELVVVDNPLVEGQQGKASQVEFAVTTRFKGTAGSLDVGNIISLVVTAGGAAAKEVSEVKRSPKKP